MARDYANIVTAIWRDRDFRALTAADQRMYLLLVTQPDISAAGTLSPRSCWSDRSCGMTRVTGTRSGAR
jgi:hypothetical protein